jgi:prevent-host-death family protein
MITITANEIKRRGIASISEIMENEHEVMISVHGKNRYVIISAEQYRHLRECELEAALIEVRADLDAGRIVDTTIAEHIIQLKNG